MDKSELRGTNGGETGPVFDVECSDEMNVSKKFRGHEKKMDRVTFRLPKEKREEIDSLVEENKYQNMSEALRSAVDTLLVREKDS